jgi:uncharacterized protein with FMN-binding domain
MNKETLSRRVFPALTLIGASGVLLAALDRPSTGIDLGAAPPIGTDASVSAAATTTIVGSAPTVATAATTTAVPATATPSQDTSASAPVTVAPVTVAPVIETTVPAAPAACSSTIVGPVISTKFGPVQVQASVDGTGVVCSAQGIVWPTADRKSVEINNQAIPLLDQWAVHTGNASFNSISGATYTSKAYKQSLQAVIDGVVK